MTRVGVVVDGLSEQTALPRLSPARLRIPNLVIVGYVLAEASAAAPLGTFARAVDAAIKFLMVSRKPERVIVLIDREQRTECSGQIAQQLREAIGDRRSTGAPTVDVEVVVKDRTFENWLVAALPTMQGSQTRFHLSRADMRAITPNKADHVDALALLKKSITHGQYEKVADSRRILAAANIDAMAANSRSFRRFLRCLGHPGYRSQSKSPRRP